MPKIRFHYGEANRDEGVIALGFEPMATRKHRMGVGNLYESKSGRLFMLQIDQRAPEFSLKGLLKGRTAEYSLKNLRGKWLVLFFYPADFTFICPTEVTGFSKAAAEFKMEQAEVWGVSVDSIESHRKWADELGGIDCPLLSDEDKSLSRLYGVLDEKEGVSLRATFIINPTGEVVYAVVSSANVGRSVEETLRVLKALRTGRLCPSDWKPGEPTGDLKFRY